MLRKYRSLGNNYRNTVVLGFDESSKKIIKLFKNKSNFGYNFLGFFSDKEYKNKDYGGGYNDFFDFCSQNIVDEIYCSLKYLNQQELKEINKFATEKDIVLKLIPETNELYRKNQSTEFYQDTIKVLNVNKLPFDYSENNFQKRFFDIFFSLFVIIFLLSWLIPVLWVIVKLESKGPLIFKQKREGLNGNEFICYKFRSMKMSKFSEKEHTKKNDYRVTKVGALLRKTSIDELPQFYNILKGEMSVIGPRPERPEFVNELEEQIPFYAIRHVIRPGLTGWAQVNYPYAGTLEEQETKLRYDLYYIKERSSFLDFKILIKTISTVLLMRGQ